eukprot:ANDGO_03050.mRNA.1 Cystatin OS=Bitis arietans PE=1 SV=1
MKFITLSVALLVVFCVYVASGRSSAGMPGGRSPADLNDPGVRAAALFAIDQINQASNSFYKGTLHEVISAETQVVAGVNYFLLLDMHTPQTNRHSKHQVVVYRDLSGNHKLSNHRVVVD